MNKRLSYMCARVHVCASLVYRVYTTHCTWMFFAFFNHERNRLPLRFTCSKWGLVCACFCAILVLFRIRIHINRFALLCGWCLCSVSFGHWQNKWPISSRGKNAIMITMSTIAAAAAAVKRNHNQIQMTKGIAQQKYTRDTHSSRSSTEERIVRRGFWFYRMASDDDSAWPNIFRNVNESARVLQSEPFVWQCKTFGNNGSSTTEKSLIISDGNAKQSEWTCTLSCCIMHTQCIESVCGKCDENENLKEHKERNKESEKRLHQLTYDWL